MVSVNLCIYALTHIQEQVQDEAIVKSVRVLKYVFVATNIRTNILVMERAID